MKNRVLPTASSILPEPMTEVSDEELEEGEDIEHQDQPIAIKVTSEVCGERLDKALSKLVPQYSRSRIQLWIEAGHVLVDGQTAKIKMTLLGDETIQVFPQPAPDEGAFQAEAMDLDIIYEDESILVINKPAGLVVHPAAGNWTGTLLNGLLYRFPHLAGVPRAGIVHRLDKDTSGLMVVAKTLEAQTDLVRQLQDRTVKREYLALVWGTPSLSGTVDKAMARHHRDRIKMAVSESVVAKPAVTHYQRLYGGQLDRHPVSLVACQLETGRTHQIRVHMLSLGFPLVGDVLYGKQHLAHYFPRQALQARRLGLLHPETGEMMEWEVDLAADMSSLLQRASIKMEG
jgi:23S rRNA pseudouridine1911/1915/1917 synthase